MIVQNTFSYGEKNQVSLYWVRNEPYLYETINDIKLQKQMSPNNVDIVAWGEGIQQRCLLHKVINYYEKEPVGIDSPWEKKELNTPNIHLWATVMETIVVSKRKAKAKKLRE